MIDRVDFEAQAFAQPGLKLRIAGLDLAGHDTERSTAIDLLEAIQDGAQVRFVLWWIAHIIDGQNQRGIDTFFANPLRGGELGVMGVWVVDVAELVENGEAITQVGRKAVEHAAKERQKNSHRDVRENTPRQRRNNGEKSF